MAKRISPSLLCLLLAGLPASIVRADTVFLKSGGEVRGEILPAPAEGQVAVRTQLGVEISVLQTDIAQIKPRSPIREEYVTRSRRLPDTAQAHWDLAEWCRANKLPIQREEQLELLLGVDPEHEESRRILGYVQENGEWLTKEEQMTRRGYVKHKGRWISNEEFEIIAETTALRAAEKAWMPRVKAWAGWLTGPDPGKSQEGFAELQKIRDPLAVAALRSSLSDHPDPKVRGLLVRLLGRIEGPEAASLLVQHHLMDTDLSVREQAKNSLDPARAALAEGYLIRSLKHKNNTVVGRAANWLGEIGTERAVVPLIDALITKHEYDVQVPSNDGASVTTGPNGQMSFGGGGNTGTAIPTQIEMLARTGQLPYGAQVIDNTPRIMKTVTVQTEVKNSAVLAALQNLTGKNFGYAERDWHLWWALQRS